MGECTPVLFRTCIYILSKKELIISSYHSGVQKRGLVLHLQTQPEKAGALWWSW